MKRWIYIVRIYPLLGSTKYRIPDVLDFERGFDGVISLLTYDDGAVVGRINVFLTACRFEGGKKNPAS